VRVPQVPRVPPESLSAVVALAAVLAYAGVKVRFYPAIVIDMLLPELVRDENNELAVTAVAVPELR
jgi:hypothetical protein